MPCATRRDTTRLASLPAVTTAKRDSFPAPFACTTLRKCASRFGAQVIILGSVIENRRHLLGLTWPKEVVKGGPLRGNILRRALQRIRESANDPRREVRQLLCKLLLLFRVIGDARVPWGARAAAALSIGYVFSPVQIIPSFIPVIGQLDDLFVVWVGIRVVRRYTPSAVLTAHLSQLGLGAARQSPGDPC